MQTDIHDIPGIDRANRQDASGNQAPNLFPFIALAPIAREILANTDRLPDADLMRVAGSLRSLADEIMAAVDRRLGARPAPRLVIDNTRRN